MLMHKEMILIINDFEKSQVKTKTLKFNLKFKIFSI